MRNRSWDIIVSKEFDTPIVLLIDNQLNAFKSKNTNI